MGRCRPPRRHPQLTLPHWAEAAAERYLNARGYRTVARNHRTRMGELDLIMRRGELLIFVEVKQRRHDRFGGPAEAIDARKLRRLQKVALQFLVTRFGSDELPTRFDAALVYGDEAEHRIEHLEAIL